MPGPECPHSLGRVLRLLEIRLRGKSGSLSWITSRISSIATSMISRGAARAWRTVAPRPPRFAGPRVDVEQGPTGGLGPVARGGGVRPPADPDGLWCRSRARLRGPRDAGQNHADGPLGVHGQRDGRALRCRLGWRLDPVALAQVTRGLVATRSGVLDHARPGQLLSAHRVPTFAGEAAWRLRHEVSPVPSRESLRNEILRPVRRAARLRLPVMRSQ